MIEYYIPFIEGSTNQNHTLRIGLTDNFPINTLLGSPFIIKSEMTVSLYNSTSYSEVFKQDFKMINERAARNPVESLDHQAGLQRTLTTAIAGMAVSEEDDT